jgi:ubiquinone/menaquinone biosynthesis C-methylase UbiE
MVNIAVVGAGQIGSRHLQALSLIDREARLQIVDPSSQSLATAKERFETVNPKNNSSFISGVRQQLNREEKLSSSFLCTPL